MFDIVNLKGPTRLCSNDTHIFDECWPFWSCVVIWQALGIKTVACSQRRVICCLELLCLIPNDTANSTVAVVEESLVDDRAFP